MTVRVLHGDCRSVLPTLPDESVNCIVTSPPYFGLRDYGVEGQIGLNPDYAAMARNRLQDDAGMFAHVLEAAE